MNGSELEPQAGTDVYAVHGADPEVLAYAMAKYSRSSLSLRESLREISAQRAEQFLNTFYFQYGHRSIADLAHIALAVERLSLLAAIVLVDEQRWDGQERSTRYQDFERSGWYTPGFTAPEHGKRYQSIIVDTFAQYRQVSDGVFQELKDRVERPENTKPDAFDRTLRARAFDVARYLLPLATNTSLGQIVNARTLETQVSRLLSHPLAEVRSLGEQLRKAAAGEAWNPKADALATFAEKVLARDGDLGLEAEGLLRTPVHVAPTLVKYAVPNAYAIETAELLRGAVADLMGDTPIADAPLVDLIADDDALEVELAASLLYPVCHYPYRQLRDAVAALSAPRRDEIIDLGLRERGRHDELLRNFSAGQRLRFDILMDIGGFRDMHRHRRCTQLLQGFTHLHGWDTPAGLGGLEEVYTRAMQTAHTAARSFAEGGGEARAADAPQWANSEAVEAAQYVLPLGTRTRALFKMDYAEAAYIAELRSAPQGHLSYRRVAWEMYRAVAAKFPSLAKHIRVTPMDEADLLRR